MHHTYYLEQWTLETFLIAMGLILVFLAIHEAGHYVALKWFKQDIQYFGVGFGADVFRWNKFRIKMFPIGAFIQPTSQYEKLSSKEKLIVAAAGPFANILFALLMYLVAILNLENNHYSHALMIMTNINIGLALVNLIPIPPLDGWIILVNYLDIIKKPFSSKQLYWAGRLGNGIMYGFGTFLLLRIFTT